MAWSSRALIACLLAAPLLGGALGGCDRKSPVPGQANASLPSPDEAAPAPAPGAGGHVDRSHKGEAAPVTAFQTLDGAPASLATFRGKPVLVNLWATWCAPCVKEMPTLDALAARGGVRVVAVSQDLDGAAKVTPYLAKAGFKALRPYLDPKLGLSLGLGANLPTTILYDAQGKERWRYAGALDWTGAEAKALLAEGM